MIQSAVEWLGEGSGRRRRALRRLGAENDQPERAAGGITGADQPRQRVLIKQDVPKTVAHASRPASPRHRRRLRARCALTSIVPAAAHTGPRVSDQRLERSSSLRHQRTRAHKSQTTQSTRGLADSGIPLVGKLVHQALIHVRLALLRLRDSRMGQRDMTVGQWHC